MGKVFPNGDPRRELRLNYAKSIAVALRGELGDTHRAIKTVMQWTGASERTIKNWFAGTRGPSGEHLCSCCAARTWFCKYFSAYPDENIQ